MFCFCVFYTVFPFSLQVLTIAEGPCNILFSWSIVYCSIWEITLDKVCILPLILEVTQHHQKWRCSNGRTSLPIVVCSNVVSAQHHVWYRPLLQCFYRVYVSYDLHRSISFYTTDWWLIVGHILRTDFYGYIGITWKA